ncbi:MAG: DnaD domain protein, partial [Clostridia bacterium]|nr:DnaD domain protein [Clostridia bacterium]
LQKKQGSREPEMVTVVSNTHEKGAKGDGEDGVPSPPPTGPGVPEQGDEGAGEAGLRVGLTEYLAGNLHPLSHGNYESLREFMQAGITAEMVMFAVDQAAAKGARNWAYVQAILDRWIVAGVKTLGDAKARDDEFRRQKARQPNGRGVRTDAQLKAGWFAARAAELENGEGST